MTKYMFKCPSCSTIMSIETELPAVNIHPVPPCPCGMSRMVDMSSDEYKYNFNNKPQKEFSKTFETNLSIDFMENPDTCVCLDCVVSKSGL